MFVVGLVGGSCSGKTTLAEELEKELLGRSSFISFDCYYKPLTHLAVEERAKTNFDHPDSIDGRLLAEHVARLRDGQCLLVPEYDFAVHDRASQFIAIEPKEVVILDGMLLGCFEEILSQVDLLIFLDVPADERLQRRLKRDVFERGRSEESIYWQFEHRVSPMHKIFVQSVKERADVLLSWNDEWEKGVKDILEIIEKNKKSS